MTDYSFVWSGGFVLIAVAPFVIGFALILLLRLTGLLGRGELANLKAFIDGFTAPLPRFPARLGALLDLVLARSREVPLPAWAVLTTGLFLLPLAGAWLFNDVSAPYSVVAGVLPWSDSAGWFHGVIRFAQTGLLDDWVVRRPLALAYLASLHGMTGGDIYWLLAGRTLLLAIACWVFLRNVAADFGPLATLCSAGLIASFAYAFTPTFLTEIPGLTFGLVATTLVWRGATKDSTVAYVAGALIFAVAFGIRTGAIFVLGAVVLWPIIGRHQLPVSRRLTECSLAFAAILTGAALSWVWSAIAYEGTNAPGANFAFTLWGLAHGGVPWHTFFDVNDTIAIAESGQTQLAYEQAFAQIRSSPAELLAGLWAFTKNYWTYLLHYLPWQIRGHAALFLCAGFAISVIHSKQRHLALIALMATGVLITAPIIFWSLLAYRALAVTVPIDALLICVALKSLQDVATQGRIGLFDSRRPGHRGGGYGIAAWLLACVTVLPGTAFVMAPSAPSATPSCLAEQSGGAFILGGTSPYIQIKPGAGAHLSPDISLGNFRRHQNFGHIDIAPTLDRLTPGQVLAFGNDVARARPPVWIIMDANAFSGVKSYLVCGTEQEIASGDNRFQILHATSIRPL